MDFTGDALGDPMKCERPRLNPGVELKVFTCYVCGTGVVETVVRDRAAISGKHSCNNTPGIASLHASTPLNVWVYCGA
jgi:hypothetical protein